MAEENDITNFGGRRQSNILLLIETGGKLPPSKNSRNRLGGLTFSMRGQANFHVLEREAFFHAAAPVKSCQLNLFLFGASRLPSRCAAESLRVRAGARQKRGQNRFESVFHEKKIFPLKLWLICWENAQKTRVSVPPWWQQLLRP